MSLKNELREFINTYIVMSHKSNALSDNDSFLDNGIIDSTGVLEMVEFLEEKFGVIVEDDEMNPENLDSIEKLAAFINNKKALCEQSKAA